MTLRILRTAALAAALAGLATTLPGEVPCCALVYRVTPSPGAGTVEVELEIQGFHGDSLVLARASGRPLVGLLNQDPKVEGVRRARWSLQEGSPRWSYARPAAGWSDPLRVRYRLAITAARPLNAWSVGLDRELLYAPAEGLFLVPAIPGQAARHAPVQVAWELPSGWRTFTGWPDESAFRGIRTLLKTNVLAGSIARHSVTACGFDLELGVAGTWDFATEGLGEELGRLACAARNRLGEPKVTRYAVSLVPARFPMTSGNRNGPHAIAFVHSMPDGSPPSTRLLAHELVHLWQRFDAPQWFLEGVNDYMALRLAREAELMSEAEYAARLAAIDSVYRLHPQRARWSFAEEQSEAPPFGPSDAYLAYRKGAMVGLALDRELRLRTGGEIDLAVLWREMNARAGWGHVEWSDADIASLASALAGGDMGSFFGTWVAGTETLPRPGTMLAGLPPLPSPRGAERDLGAVATLLQTALSRSSF